jgi:hypothetical protein
MSSSTLALVPMPPQTGTRATVGKHESLAGNVSGIRPSFSTSAIIPPPPRPHAPITVGKRESLAGEGSGVRATSPRPTFAPRPPEDVVMAGTLESVAGDVSVLRVMLSAVFPREKPIATKLEFERDAPRVLSVANVRSHVVVNLRADGQIGGSYPFTITATGGDRTGRRRER